jgi:hypothetical protein
VDGGGWWDRGAKGGMVAKKPVPSRPLLAQFSTAAPITSRRGVRLVSGKVGLITDVDDADRQTCGLLLD